MRRAALLLAVLGIVAVGAANAPAKPGSVQVRGVCNVQGIDVFFWPQGHPAIPVIGFPSFGQPHVEFHTPRDHTDNGALAYMDVTQAGMAPGHCTSATDAAMPFATGATTQTTSTAQKIRCGLTGNVDLRLAAWTRTTSRVVVRTIRVKGKKKKVRRTVRSTRRVGVLATIGSAGTTGAVVDIRLSAVAGTSSSMKWDTRSCAAVDVAG